MGSGEQAPNQHVCRPLLILCKNPRISHCPTQPGPRGPSAVLSQHCTQHPPGATQAGTEKPSILPPRFNSHGRKKSAIAASAKSRFPQNLVHSRYFHDIATEITWEICSLPLTRAEKPQANPARGCTSCVTNNPLHRPSALAGG